MGHGLRTFSRDQAPSNFAQSVRVDQAHEVVSSAKIGCRADPHGPLGRFVTSTAGFYTRFGKRTLDIGVSTLTLLVTFPLVALFGACIWLESGLPVFYRQIRVGAEGTPFTLIKLRTMPVGTPTLETANASHLETTRVGGFLRRLSLDELPQLINVIIGDMSLVGPRPAILSQVELLSFREVNGSIRLKPGITGLAQVYGFDGMTNRDKAALDGEYCSSLSLSSDVKLLFKTLTYPLRRPPQY